MAFSVSKIRAALGSRLARNIYLWVILLYIVHSMNTGNEKAYHYGLIRSAWYWPVILIGMVLQMTLVYVNNLILVPRFLVRKRRLLYGLLLFLLVGAVSVIYTIGLKIADAHIRIDDLQQIGMVTAPVSSGWTATDIAGDTNTYFIGNLLWVLIFTMAWYMNDYARQRRLAEQAQQQQVATELSFLKNQLNPHFLFNTLNNLYALALRKSDEAPDAILKLSAILRYLLYESNSGHVSFEKEKEIMQAYISLELLRLKETGHLNFSITADGSYRIPPLLWLPVLENVFKHGTRVINAATPVDYEFRIAANQLRIYSRNGHRPAAGTTRNEGIGMANLGKRLSLLYPGRYTLHSGQQQQDYITEVTIHLTEA